MSHQDSADFTDPLDQRRLSDRKARSGDSAPLPSAKRPKIPPKVDSQGVLIDDDGSAFVFAEETVHAELKANDDDNAARDPSIMSPERLQKHRFEILYSHSSPARTLRTFSHNPLLVSVGSMSKVMIALLASDSTDDGLSLHPSLAKGIVDHHDAASSKYLTIPTSSSYKRQSITKTPLAENQLAKQQRGYTKAYVTSGAQSTQQSAAATDAQGRTANAPVVGAVSSHTCICGNPSVFLCSICKSQTYCGLECQRAHWTVHSKFCAMFARSAQTSTSASSTTPLAQQQQQQQSKQISQNLVKPQFNATPAVIQQPVVVELHNNQITGLGSTQSSEPGVKEIALNVDDAKGTGISQIATDSSVSEAQVKIIPLNIATDANIEPAPIINAVQSSSATVVLPPGAKSSLLTQSADTPVLPIIQPQMTQGMMPTPLTNMVSPPQINLSQPSQQSMQQLRFPSQVNIYNSQLVRPQLFTPYQVGQMSAPYQIRSVNPVAPLQQQITPAGTGFFPMAYYKTQSVQRPYTPRAQNRRGPVPRLPLSYTPSRPNYQIYRPSPPHPAPGNAAIPRPSQLTPVQDQQQQPQHQQQQQQQQQQPPSQQPEQSLLPSLPQPFQ